MPYVPRPVPVGVQEPLGRFLGDELRQLRRSFAELEATRKAGMAVIADASSTTAVAFGQAFVDDQYSLAVSVDGNEHIWITAKSASGFTLNRVGSSGARSVDWTATRYRDPEK